MSATAHALRLQQHLEDDAAWRLLRADNAPVIAALLREHLSSDSTRMDADELYERIDADLDNLRGRGLALPQTSRAYVAQWRTAGFIIRRPTQEARGETLELSSGGTAALRFLDARESPRRTLTHSRLSSLSAQLRQLAIDTDPRSDRRLERLREERDAIDARIADIEEGTDDALVGERAIERVEDLLAQASEVPDDFARVRAEFENLNSVLRARILDPDDAGGDVLEDVFRGVDLIADSDAGRSFAGFSALVLDPALGAAFEDDARQVLDRDFAGELTAGQRRALREFLDTLKDRSAEVHTVITQFARGLRRYVHSQDYRRDRVLQGLIRETMATARRAAPHIRPYRPLGTGLELTSVAIRSIGAVSLHDPADLDAAGDIETHEGEVANLDQLRALARETEIDFDELVANINAVLADLEDPSVRDVLEARPATQGVASIVGLLSLAATYGRVEPDTETLAWSGADHQQRHATVQRHRFTERIA